MGYKQDAICWVHIRIYWVASFGYGEFWFANGIVNIIQISLLRAPVPLFCGRLGVCYWRTKPKSNLLFHPKSGKFKSLRLLLRRSHLPLAKGRSFTVYIITSMEMVMGVCHWTEMFAMTFVGNTQ